MSFDFVVNQKMCLQPYNWEISVDCKGIAQNLLVVATGDYQG